MFKKEYEDLEIEIAFFPNEDVVEDSVKDNPDVTDTDVGEWF